MSKEEKNTYTIKTDENLGEVKIADEVVVKVTDELFTLESEYMRIFIEPSKVNISLQVLQQWK